MLLSISFCMCVAGGGLTQGGNIEYRERGAAMVLQGNVVNININYRLGVLGFLSLPALAREVSSPNELPCLRFVPIRSSNDSQLIIQQVAIMDYWINVWHCNGFNVT
jgi:hypothetical protein